MRASSSSSIGWPRGGQYCLNSEPDGGREEARSLGRARQQQRREQREDHSGHALAWARWARWLGCERGRELGEPWVAAPPFATDASAQEDPLPAPQPEHAIQGQECSSEEPAHHTGNGGGDGHARVRDAELVGRVPGARTADGAASSAVEQVSCRASQLWSKAAGRTGRAHHWQR